MVARRWAITLGHPVKPAQVVLCLIDLKLARLADAPADSDVLLIWSLAGGTGSTSVAALYRLHRDTAEAVLGENEFEAKESSAPTDAYSAHGIARWQTGAVPGSNTFSIEFATGGTNNAHHENARLRARSR